ncbi:MAG: hypothetical protein E7162_05555 [Firmicutes bacterium]|nr:hypothetical protein [Bacillota bacterium]
MQEEIKALLNEECIIIFDTNVYLTIYSQAPEYTAFEFKCLEKIKNNIYMPMTVWREFEKQHESKYHENLKNCTKVLDKFKKELEVIPSKISVQLNTLKSFGYPELDELENNLLQKASSISEEIEKYLSERQGLTKIKPRIFEKDIVNDFVCQNIKNGRIFDEPTLSDTLSWMEKYDSIKDGSDIPGGRDQKKLQSNKYHDYIIWCEIKRYCKANNKNCIFVTNDKKDDWYDEINNIKIFKDNLEKEFLNDTNQKIIGLSSKDFFESVSNIYEIENKNKLKYAVEALAEKYKSIIDVDDVINNEVYNLILNPYKYINGEESVSVGNEKFDLDEEYDIVSFDIEVQNITDEVIYYLVDYTLDMKGESYDYYGRDDDTKEVVLSPPIEHSIEANISLLVKKEINSYFDFSSDDYEVCGTIKKEIKVVTYTPYDDMLYYENEIDDSQNSICPKCGKIVLNENMSGTGFCINCENEELVANE